MGSHHVSHCRLFTIALRSFSRAVVSILTLSLLLAGCSNPSRPAPLVVLNSQHELPDTPQQTSYTVQSGDTLFAIAWYTGNDYRDIAKWNKISKPYKIKVGDSILIKPSATWPKPKQKIFILLINLPS